MTKQTIDAARSAVLTCQMYYGSCVASAITARRDAEKMSTPEIRRRMREYALHYIGEAREARDTARNLNEAISNEVYKVICDAITWP